MSDSQHNEPSGSGSQPKGSGAPKKRVRGPTRCAGLAQKDPTTRRITFASDGTPTGSMRVDFKTSISYIVKETVPITIKTWNDAQKIDGLMDRLWDRVKIYICNLTFHIFNNIFDCVKYFLIMSRNFRVNGISLTASKGKTS